jgi:hypothetical protein
MHQWKKAIEHNVKDGVGKSYKPVKKFLNFMKKDIQVDSNDHFFLIYLVSCLIKILTFVG